MAKPTTYRQTGRVYLLWAEGTHFFKIGYTGKTVNERAYTLAMAGPLPLRIIGDISGGVPTEVVFHKRLAKYRSHGEWFVLPERVLRVVLGWFGYDARAIFAPNKIHAGNRP